MLKAEEIVPWVPETSCRGARLLLQVPRGEELQDGVDLHEQPSQAFIHGSHGQVDALMYCSWELFYLISMSLDSHKKNKFIDGFKWIVTRPAFGATQVQLSSETLSGGDEEATDGFDDLRDILE